MATTFEFNGKLAANESMHWTEKAVLKKDSAHLSLPVIQALCFKNHQSQFMPKYNTIFESNETIYGIVPRAHDWVEYSCILKVKDGGKFPVSLEMKFIPPHPFAFNMPLEKSIKAESISEAYWKVIKFFSQNGIEFKR